MYSTKELCNVIDKDDLWGYIDHYGNVVIECKYQFVGGFYNSNIAPFMLDDKYGYLDKNGTIIVEPIYEKADYFRDGYAVAYPKYMMTVDYELVKSATYSDFERHTDQQVNEYIANYVIINEEGEELYIEENLLYFSDLAQPNLMLVENNKATYYLKYNLENKPMSTISFDNAPFKILEPYDRIKNPYLNGEFNEDGTVYMTSVFPPIKTYDINALIEEYGEDAIVEKVPLRQPLE